MILWILFFSWAVSAEIVALPDLSKSPVVDQAGMLTPQEEQAIDFRLRELRKNKKIVMAVAIVPTLGEETIEQFSIRLAEQSKLGDDRVDNGLILVMATKERKIRLEVGQGLEGEITDYQSDLWIRELITPLLKEGRPYLAIMSLVSAISPESSNQSGNGQWPKGRMIKSRQLPFPINSGLIIGLGLIAFILIPLLGVFIKNAGVRAMTGGAMFGLVGAWSLGLALIPIITLALIGFVVGLVGPLQILYLLASASGGRGGQGFGGGGGGSWGGGGGRYSGGGASGSW